jgi:putative ABC transport system ATP-binding protein
MKAGESAALLGESGVGKTTLINLIAGLDSVDTGEVIVDDINISSLSDSALTDFRRNKLGLIFQKFHLVPSLNSWDNSALQARLGQRFDPEFAKYLFGSLSIDHLTHRYPSQLSGGQQQRVAIARALMHKPSLVLADEPTGNLDEATSEKVIDLLVHITNQIGATLVVVTHSSSISAHLAQRWQLGAGQVSEVK